MIYEESFSWSCVESRDTVLRYAIDGCGKQGQEHAERLHTHLEI